MALDSPKNPSIFHVLAAEDGWSQAYSKPTLRSLTLLFCGVQKKFTLFGCGNLTCSKKTVAKQNQT